MLSRNEITIGYLQKIFLDFCVRSEMQPDLCEPLVELFKELEAEAINVLSDYDNVQVNESYMNLLRAAIEYLNTIIKEDKQSKLLFKPSIVKGD